LATKDKKSSAKQTASTTKVTRITASDSAKPAVKTTKATPKKTTPILDESKKTKRKNPLAATIGYFVGAWYELRQVRWPNRKATWSLTLAVLIFTLFFMVLILLLDALFKYLFELILG